MQQNTIFHTLTSGLGTFYPADHAEVLTEFEAAKNSPQLAQVLVDFPWFAPFAGLSTGLSDREDYERYKCATVYNDAVSQVAHVMSIALHEWFEGKAPVGMVNGRYLAAAMDVFPLQNGDNRILNAHRENMAPVYAWAEKQIANLFSNIPRADLADPGGVLEAVTEKWAKILTTKAARLRKKVMHNGLVPKLPECEELVTTVEQPVVITVWPKAGLVTATTKDIRNEKCALFASAQCCSEDEFDATTGAKIALNRLKRMALGERDAVHVPVNMKVRFNDGEAFMQTSHQMFSFPV